MIRSGSSGAVPGTVYLVGAGPGDPDLLTLRAVALLEHADIVFHDHLISGAILERRGRHTRLVNVGKVGHGERTDQAAIEERLIASARANLVVVRLKGGDPLLFGRGAEEAAALGHAGVPFQIVPGVSSAIGAPASAGIPLTARGVARSVAIVTGHCADNVAPPAIPDADTVVVLMGIANARAICEQLMNQGRSPDLPAAVVQSGTCPDQRVAVATLATLADVIVRETFTAPALLIFGETVRLRSVVAPNRSDPFCDPTLLSELETITT